MGLISKTVKMKWHHSNKDWYVSKGYTFTKMRDEFEVKVEDLTDGSNVYVEVTCDCEECKAQIIKSIRWYAYKICVKNDGKYYFNTCAMKLFGTQKSLITRLNNSISFGHWLTKNLSLKQAVEIISRWDDKKNGCDIREVSYNSAGFNKQGYWFKCSYHPKHESELKSINRFVSGQKGSINCNQCNSFAQYLIDTYGEDALERYWDYERNTVNPWKISKCTNEIKVYIKCQEKDYHESYLIDCSNFVMGNRCSYCRGFKIHPLDSLGKLLKNRDLLHIWSGKNNKSPFEYSPMSSKCVWWKCPDGKHEDYLRSIDRSNIRDFRCPDCQFSKGEKRIENYLITNQIYYIPQKEFDGLLGLGDGNLSYDFYLHGHNLLIEYQGIQHEKFTPGLHKSKKDFEKQLEHDKRKKDYAQLHNIKLLEIWYWDFESIEKILEKELFT